MSERYTRVFVLPANLYTTGSPVVVSAGVLLKDSQTNTILAQLKFRNISPKTIIGLRIKLRLFDNFGNTIEMPVEYDYLDLKASRNTEFGQKTAVPLPDSRARMYEITAVSAVFEDRSILTASDRSWETLASPARLQFPDPELQKQYEINFGKRSTFKPLIVRDLWYCTCGALNHKSEDCHKCHNSLIALQSLDLAGLIAQKDARLAQEAAEAAARKAAQEAAAAAAREKAAAEAAARKQKREAAAAAKQQKREDAAAAKQQKREAAATAKQQKQEAATAAKQQEQEAATAAKQQEREAVAVAKKQKQEAAAAAKRAKAESSKKSKAWIVTISLLCTTAVLAALAYFVGLPAYKYYKAVKLMENGDYEQAIVAFEAMDGYRDSEQMVALCTLENSYLEAKQLMESKEFHAAMQIFEQLAPHKDSESLIETCKKEFALLKKEEGQKLQKSALYRQAVEAFLEAEAYGISCSREIRECEELILTTHGAAPYVSTGTPIGNESNVEYTVKASALTVHSITAVELSNSCVRFTIDCTSPELYALSYTGTSNKPPKMLGNKITTTNIFFYNQRESVKAERQTFVFDVPKEYLIKTDYFTAEFFRTSFNMPEKITILETY